MRRGERSAERDSSGEGSDAALRWGEPTCGITQPDPRARGTDISGTSNMHVPDTTSASTVAQIVHDDGRGRMILTDREQTRQASPAGIAWQRYRLAVACCSAFRNAARSSARSKPVTAAYPAGPFQSFGRAPMPKGAGWVWRWAAPAGAARPSGAVRAKSGASAPTASGRSRSLSGTAGQRGGWFQRDSKGCAHSKSAISWFAPEGSPLGADTPPDQTTGRQSDTLHPRGRGFLRRAGRARQTSRPPSGRSGRDGPDRAGGGRRAAQGRPGLGARPPEASRRTHPARPGAAADRGRPLRRRRTRWRALPARRCSDKSPSAATRARESGGSDRSPTRRRLPPWARAKPISTASISTLTCAWLVTTGGGSSTSAATCCNRR